MSTLFSGQSLLPGQTLQSDNQWFTLTMQSDGNVVLYNTQSKPLWQTNTAGINPREFIMQTDGNLVLYDTSGQPHWESNTQGNPGAFLNVQDDGNLVVYRAGSTSQTANNALWDAGLPPPLNLTTVVASGAMLNVGDARLDYIAYDMLFRTNADSGGFIVPPTAPYTEQGFWSSVGPVSCGGTTVTVNVTGNANWGFGGLGWTSSQLQQAFAGALQAVMQAFATKTAYQNYSYTEFPDGDIVVCLDPQPLDQGYYIPPELQITAYDNGGAQIGQVTVIYSTGDQSGGGTCDILSALGTVLAIFPPASELAAIVGVGTSLACS